MIGKKGFTLIELLIVVAIIAILAAIALPNFLEAQVRAKTSRVKSDMRTVVVAMNCYIVDHNNIPIGAWARYGADSDDEFEMGYLTARPWSIRISSLIAPPLLTTPISYLGAIPVDPFNTHVIRKHIGTYAGEVGHWWGACPLNRHPWPKEGDGEWALHGPGHFYWHLMSCGPSLNWDCNTPGIQYPDVTYDPTNGTVSAGDLIYTDTRGFADRK